MEQARLTEDTLFLACTRPAMVWGVPIEAMAGNAMLTSLVFILMKNPLYGVVGIGLHVVFRALADRDHNGFRVLFLWLETKGRSRNGSLWGGSSASPLDLRPVRQAWELRVHA